MDNRHFIAKKVASFFRDGDVINLGAGMPVLVGDYITDNVVIQSENGLLGSAKSYPGIDPEAHYFNASGNTVDLIPGACVFDICTSFGMIRQGLVKATVLGAFEVSQYGDLANWARPGSYPGMGGAMDLVNGSKTVILAMIHTQGDKPKIVEKCTLPLTGYKVVDMIVTELCVLKVTPEGLELAEYNPELGGRDTAVRIIQEKTAAKLHISPDLKPMRLPD